MYLNLIKILSLKNNHCVLEDLDDLRREGVTKGSGSNPARQVVNVKWDLQ